MDAHHITRIVNAVKSNLTDDLRQKQYRGKENCLAGHCYVASEAVYHMLGGKDSGWVPQNVRHEGGPHWYLKHKFSGAIIDPTAEQFDTPVPYHEGVGKGFLTKQPSKRAQTVLDRVTHGPHLAKSVQLDKKILDPSFGYSFSHEHHDLGGGKMMTKVNVHSPTGEHVGAATFAHHNNSLVPGSVVVDEDHQRRGIASAMYAHAQKHTGKSITPSANQTPEGASLWSGNSQLKQFGKSAGEGVSPQPRLSTVPAHVQRSIISAKTPQEMSEAITHHEPELAKLWGNRQFLNCDEAATLLSDGLKHKKIPHHMMLGETDKGESHSWVMLNDRTHLDPTNQGTVNGQVTQTWHPAVGIYKADEFTNPDDKRVASVAVFNSEGHLLMGLRTDSKKWNLPGGKAEPGETPEECARREVMEETGLKITSLEYLGSGQGGLNGDVRIFSYKAKSDGKPTSENDPDQECEEWEWVDVRTGLPKEMESVLHNGKRDVTLQLLGLQEGSADMGAELSKSWKHAFAGAIAAAGLAGGIASAQELPAQKWTPAGLVEGLHPIAQLESGMGRNVNHKPHSKGEFHTAVGAVGLKPVTAHDEYLKSPWLQKTFPDLMNPERFTQELKNNFAFYNHVASAHWTRLKRLFGGDDLKAAYAWRWGQGAALTDPPEVQAGDPYVTAYAKIRDHKRMQLVGNALQNPLGKQEVAEWLMKAQTSTKKMWRSKDGVSVPATGTAERESYDQRFLQRLQETFGAGNGKTLRQLRIPLANVSNSWGNLPVVKDRLDLYTRMARGGDTLPPVIVRRAGEKMFDMIDGNHRTEAAKRAGLKHLDAYEIVDEKPKIVTAKIPKGTKLYDLGEDEHGLMQPKVKQTKYGQFFEPVEFSDVEKKIKKMGYHGYHGHERDPNQFVLFSGSKAATAPSVEQNAKRKV